MESELGNWSVEELKGLLIEKSLPVPQRKVLIIEAILNVEDLDLEANQYSKWTLTSLRERAKEIGESTAGSKNQLIKRINQSPLTKESISEQKTEEKEAEKKKKVEKIEKKEEKKEEKEEETVKIVSPRRKSVTPQIKNAKKSPEKVWREKKTEEKPLKLVYSPSSEEESSPQKSEISKSPKQSPSSPSKFSSPNRSKQNKKQWRRKSKSNSPLNTVEDEATTYQSGSESANSSEELSSSDESGKSNLRKKNVILSPVPLPSLSPSSDVQTQSSPSPNSKKNGKKNSKKSRKPRKSVQKTEKVSPSQEESSSQEDTEKTPPASPSLNKTPPYSPASLPKPEILSFSSQESGSSQEDNGNFVHLNGRKIPNSPSKSCLKTPESPAKGRSVKWREVEVRTYHRTLGSSTVPNKGGFALGLDWKYDEQNVLKRSVSEYETILFKITKGQDNLKRYDEKERKKLLLEVQDDVKQLNDQLSEIRKSRKKNGCNCSQSKTGTSCKDNKCVCIRYGIECNEDSCGCTHEACKNPKRHTFDLEGMEKFIKSRLVILNSSKPFSEDD
eukprot:TRINITY_DN4775_c0_g1_i1.p1 TRINITY_DN4775_c0_g1~~TRINITY_DN4775_c0_g1_i1.p1  ORF type:complete len:558 (-),score=238.18 TRINITY_DN4775_c0_g1_i1:23-1696(-)